MMSYSIYKSFIGALFIASSAPSAAFSLSSPLKAHSTHRLTSKLMYTKIDQFNTTTTFLPPLTDQLATKKTKHLVKIDFDEDLSKDIDSTRPYYNLENEHSILDDTGKCHGIICTIKSSAPIGRETGDLSLFNFLRASGCVNSAMALLMANPGKKKHIYPNCDYSVDVNPSHNIRFERELSSISNCEEFFKEAAPDDPVFIICGIEMTKRSGTSFGVLKTKDTFFYITGRFHIIPMAVFKKRFPSPSTTVRAPYTSVNPYENLTSKLHHFKKYSSLYQDWVCVEATLPPVQAHDCIGHIEDCPCLPHSSMIFHTCDLIGLAIGELTGLEIPFKKSDFGEEHGLKLLHFDAEPQNLIFPETYGLKFQARVYCSSGKIGTPGSTYIVEASATQDVTGLVCFTATGRFALSPVFFNKNKKVIAN